MVTAFIISLLMAVTTPTGETPQRPAGCSGQARTEPTVLSRRRARGVAPHLPVSFPCLTPVYKQIPCQLRGNRDSFFNLWYYKELAWNGERGERRRFFPGGAELGNYDASVSFEASSRVNLTLFLPVVAFPAPLRRSLPDKAIRHTLIAFPHFSCWFLDKNFRFGVT
jgi:hypothetical protein